MSAEDSEGSRRVNMSGHWFNNITNCKTNLDGLVSNDRGISSSAAKDEPLYPSSLLNDVDENAFSVNKENSQVRMELPDDLLHLVFSFLGHTDLCCASLVCRQWRAESTHEDFWRCLNFENKNISIGQFEDMCQRYANAVEVNITGASSMHLLVMTAISSLRNLETLSLGGGQLQYNFFHALTGCNLLRTLNVTGATLGSGINQIPIEHDRLRHLQLIKCNVTEISVRCPQLETLSLKGSDMCLAHLNCPLLHDLDIGYCHKLFNSAIRAAAMSCPLLESLDMSNCSYVNNGTLREISQSCANLRILNASHNPGITLESVRLPMLKVLKLNTCNGITSASIGSIVFSSMLEVLELDNCGLLTSVSLDLSYLQHISLVNCHKFADLNLQTPALTSIIVSNCPALHSISITSNSLQKLVLQKQERLTTLALQCRSLQEVDFTDCESLKDSVCDVFSDGGGCPMLRTLVLDNCKSLKVARFCSTSIVSLSLAGCHAITTLELTSPYLQQVCLDDCEHLERASFCPVGLRSLNLGICAKLSMLVLEAPDIVSLELKGCGVLSEASINCPLLTFLDASFCSQLKDEWLSAITAASPLIDTLILTACLSIGYDGLRSLSFLPHLSSLDLSYTFLIDLVPVFESCSYLKVLRLHACKFLTDTCLEPLYKKCALPSLQEIDLSYGSLSQSAMEELLGHCTRLTHVNLNGCINMHDLDWSSGEWSEMIHRENSQPRELLLQILNCVGCPNIRKVLIPPSARCFHLSSLNLSLSSNLKEVDISCLSLCHLYLSNCCSLEILKLDCPKLTTLFLQSCNIDEDTLEAAISRCFMLQRLDVSLCPKIISAGMGRLSTVRRCVKWIFNSSQPA